MTDHPSLRTAATELFGVRYPIVQTGMGWVSGARLTAATAAAGGLGILARPRCGCRSCRRPSTRSASAPTTPSG
ncbi:MAG: nitronate monooxygenase [Microthrixaceae bacterium]